MKPAPFTYHDPRTLDDTLDLLAALPNARLLAGGQSLMPMMNFRFVQPDHVIDLNGVERLAGIEVREDVLHLGAMTRQRDIEFSADLAQHCPILTEALTHVGHRQTRNRGTIGGSLCHLDPSAELVNCLSAHDGVLIHAQSKRNGRRDIAFSEFAAGYMTHSLQDDELVVGVTLPKWSPGHGYSFVECARRKGDFAIAAVAVLLDLDPRTGAIARCAISVAGVTATPVRAAAAENALVGQDPEPDVFGEATAMLEFSEPLSDAYVSARYRIHLAKVLTGRALEAAAQKARERRADA